MATIDLTATDPANVARVAAYFGDVHLDDLLTDDPDIVGAPPTTCSGCEQTPLVPWFTVCFPCVDAGTCDHDGEDRIIGPGYTACALCGAVLTQEAS